MEEQAPETTARRAAILIARGLCLCVVLGTVIRYLGRWHWIFELTSHFVVQATILAALATLLLLVFREGKLAAVTACLTLVNATEWVPYDSFVSSVSDARSPDETLVVVSANVYSRNRNSTDLHQWLQNARADVVFISEVDPWWADKIESWKADWPYQVLKPRSDNFGLALMSRFPISESHLFDLDGAIPAIDCKIQASSGEWTIIGLHPVPPIGARNSQLRNQQLQTAAEHIRLLTHPRVVLGDFNSTPSSPMFQDFLSVTGLQDSRKGFGWQPTWPAGNALLRIPIDHCLVDPEAQVLDRTVGPDIGSDHFPILCRLSDKP